jgi:hypothetical protein
MNMNNKEWGQILRDAVVERTGSRNAVRLPNENLIAFTGTRACPVISMTSNAICIANMQTNAAAFEAWTVALLAWGKAERVHLRWEKPVGGDETSRHFARFSYRVERLKALLGDRITLDEPDEVVRYRDKLLKCSPILNVARGSDLSHKPSPPHSEGEAEKCFKRQGNSRRQKLMDEYRLVRLCRQFPVGLFKKSVKRGNEIFTGGKSAIDLIGVDCTSDLTGNGHRIGSPPSVPRAGMLR